MANISRRNFLKSTPAALAGGAIAVAAGSALAKASMVETAVITKTRSCGISSTIERDHYTGGPSSSTPSKLWPGIHEEWGKNYRQLGWKLDEVRNSRLWLS